MISILTFQAVDNKGMQRAEENFEINEWSDKIRN